MSVIHERGRYSVLNIRVTNLDFGTIRVTDANGETVTYNLKEELAVNNFNVREEFLKQPAKYSYWTALLEQLRLYQETYELQAEKRKAELYEPSRQQLILSGIAKPTKDQIDAQVMLDDEYYKLRQDVVNMEFTVRQVQYVVKAFEQRKDMLIQYGADLRRDFEYSKKVSMPEAPQNQNSYDPYNRP